MKSMRLGMCRECKGDLLLEDDEWRCLQCGCSYYPEHSSSVADDTPQPTRRDTPRRLHKDNGPTSAELSAFLRLSPAHIRE